MGTVYLGQDGDRQVAVKVLHSHLLDQEGAFKRFQREARVGQRIDHPRVVKTYDCDLAVVEGEPRCYLVTEYVEGRTLDRLLEDLGRVPESLLREIGRQVAEGLEAIHDAGVVHRDLKPANILITREDEIKIMDLGLAWLPEGQRLSQTGQFLGTLLYASPEQVKPEGRTLDGRADLYALGLLLHELAAGAHPFDGAKPYEVIEKNLSEAPPPLGAGAEEITPFFESVVTRLLEKRPEDRLPSAGRLREVLAEGERSTWWRERTARERPRKPRRLRLGRETALRGREAELSLLRTWFGEVEGGLGRVALLEGEAGVGKTRLVDELVATLIAGGEEPVFLSGAFPPGGAATGVGAYVQALREHLDEDGIESELATALGSTPLLVPAFAALLRGEPPPAGAEPLSREALIGAFARVVGSLAEDRPVVWLVDDLQFAPEEGLATLAALMFALREHAVLLIATMHPGLSATWLGDMLRQDRVERLRLGRLDVDVIESILREALGSESLGAMLGRTVAVESDGNPFFVFEILRSLRAKGTLEQLPDGSWRAVGQVNRIELPDSVRGLVRARLENLDPDDRNALDTAACCGFEFDPVLVADALGVGRIPMLRRFAGLARNGRLIHPVGRRFAFDHHLVQDELYQEMSAPLREELHAALGDCLEKAEGGPDHVSGAMAAEICRHGLLGRRDVPARRHLSTALQHLGRSYDYLRAAELSGRALAREGLLTGEERVDVLLKRASWMHVLGRIESEEQLLAEAEREVDGLGDAGLIARVGTSVATLDASRGRYDDAHAGFASAAAVAHEAGLAVEEITAIMGGAGCHADRGEFGEARLHYERALTLARETDDPRGVAGATGNLGFLALEQGRPEDARPLFERAREMFETIGDRRGLAMARGALGLVLGKLGHHEEALEHHEAHRRAAREIGDRRGESAATGNVGTCYLNLGHLEDAIRHFRRDRSIAHELGNARAEATSTANLAVAYFECGALDEARDMADCAVEIGQSLGHVSVEASGLRSLGRVDEERGRVAEARDLYDRAITVSEASGNVVDLAESLLARGRLEQNGASPEARGFLERSLEIARQAGIDGVHLVASASLAAFGAEERTEGEKVFEALEARVRVRETIEGAVALWEATGRERYRDLARTRIEDVLAASPADRRAEASRLSLNAQILPRGEV